MEDIDGRFDRSDRNGIEGELTTEAAHDAQKRAEATAAAFGQHLGPVQAISQESLREVNYRFLESPAFAAGLGAPRETMESGPRKSAFRLLVPVTIEFEEHLNALYRLGER